MPTVEKRSVSLPSEKDRRALHGYTVEEMRALWEAGLASGPSRLADLDALKAEGRRRLAGGRAATRRS